MPNKFCHECGKPAQPTWKACPYCTTSFASLSEVPKNQTVARPNQPIMRPGNPTVAAVRDGEDDDTMYLDTVAHFQPNISALEVEIPKPRFSNVESLAQIATNPFSMVSDTPRIAPPTISAEEALQQFKNEAGGPTKRIEIN